MPKIKERTTIYRILMDYKERTTILGLVRRARKSNTSIFNEKTSQTGRFLY
jgi:hypothetical protein